MATKPIRMFASLALAALLVFGCGGSSERLSEEVRTYPIEMLDGQPTTLATFADRPTVINFFGSWCKPCVLEMPDIEALHVELGDRAKFIGIDTQENADAGREIVTRTGVTYPIGLDTDGSLLTKVKGIGMPTTLVVKADGTIVARHTGALTTEQLRDLVNKALG